MGSEMQKTLYYRAVTSHLLHIIFMPPEERATFITGFHTLGGIETEYITT
jgi:hypothetical protein